MALQTYAELKLYIDGSEQLEATNVSVEINPQRNPVDTMGKGRAGYTEGARIITVTGNAAVPAAGLEFDWFSASIKGTVHSVQVPVGNKVLKFKGVFQTSSASQSVNAATESSFTIEGPADDDTVA
jgi:hypothetical protein